MLTLFFLQAEVVKNEEVCVFTEEPHLYFDCTLFLGAPGVLICTPIYTSCTSMYTSQALAVLETWPGVHKASGTISPSAS